MEDRTQTIFDKLPDIIDIARYAPSVHNTQPWNINAKATIATVSIDRDHQLADGDPTGRQTFISMGIFIEAMVIAARKFGLAPKRIWLHENTGNIEFKKSTSPKASREDIQALKNRVTDRSIYHRLDIDDKALSDIIASYTDKRAQVWAIKDRDEIGKIAELTGRGIGVALSNPSFRQELSRYLVNPWSKERRGISTLSLYIPKIIAINEPLLMRLGIGKNAEVSLEKRRWQSASGVILITTEGDMPKYWFEAGRAYLRVALKIEQLGLSQATSAATVEASNYHEDVEQILKTNQRLQCVIRIGKGSTKRNHSPRVSASDLIT